MLNCLLVFLLTFLSQPDTVLRHPGAVSVVPSRIRLCAETDTVEIAAIAFVGNRKTREQILRAELDFSEGEVLTTGNLEKRLEKNRLRLYNLQLFLWVRYETVCQNGRLTLIFEVQERWYLFPTPIFSLADRNFNAWWEKKDLNRLDYGLHLVQNNFRGRNELLKVNLQQGFNRKYELFYSVPYVNKKHNLGFNVGGSVYQSHSIDYNTRDNILLTLREDEYFSIQKYYISGGVNLRENVQKQTSFTASYHHEKLSDSAFYLNSAYFSGRKNRDYVDLDVSRVYNFRNTFSYPLVGRYLQLGLSERFFLNKTGYSNLTAFAKFAHYLPLNNGFYYSYSLEGQMRLAGMVAYADNVALGYKSYIRGYELFVIGGQHYGLVKQGFAHLIADLNQVKLNFIRNPKFNRIPLSLYMNLFVDVGYVVDGRYEQTNFLTNRLNMAAGLGLHMVTYYDRVITLEYSLTREGQTGLYLHTAFPF